MIKCVKICYIRCGLGFCLLFAGIGAEYNNGGNRGNAYALVIQKPFHDLDPGQMLGNAVTAGAALPIDPAGGEDGGILLVDLFVGVFKGGGGQALGGQSALAGGKGVARLGAGRCLHRLGVAVDVISGFLQGNGIRLHLPVMV